jgi:hypothetical protein
MAGGRRRSRRSRRSEERATARRVLVGIGAFFGLIILLALVGLLLGGVF